MREREERKNISSSNYTGFVESKMPTYSSISGKQRGKLQIPGAVLHRKGSLRTNSTGPQEKETLMFQFTLPYSLHFYFGVVIVNDNILVA